MGVYSVVLDRETLQRIKEGKKEDIIFDDGTLLTISCGKQPGSVKVGE